MVTETAAASSQLVTLCFSISLVLQFLYRTTSRSARSVGEAKKSTQPLAETAAKTTSRSFRSASGANWRAPGFNTSADRQS